MNHEIVTATEKIVDNFWKLLADEGIKVTDYQAIEDVPI